MDLQELKGLRFFEGVVLETGADLLAECHVRTLQRDDILIAPGASNHRLHLVVTGRLRVHLDNLDSPAVALLGPGDSVGEFSIIDQQPTSVFVVAADSCRLLVVDERIFWALVDRVPGVARNLLASLTQRLRRNNVAIADGTRPQRGVPDQGATDPLTGLHNRRWLNEILPREIRRSVRDGRRLSLMMLDVDRFKQYNDTHGHLAGDGALAGVAHTLGKHLRPTDLLARCGGEEFVVVLPNTDLERAKMVAERLRRAVSMTELVAPDDTRIEPVTISVGIAQLQPAQRRDDLIATADAALRRAKSEGRNRVAG